MDHLEQLYLEFGAVIGGTATGCRKGLLFWGLKLFILGLGLR